MSTLSNPFAHHDPKVQASENLIDSAALGRVGPLREALANGGDPNFMRLDISPALAAVSNEHEECLRILVDAGGGGDLPNRMGWTALHEAAIKDDVQFLEILLGSEFEQNLAPRDRDGLTPLHAAIEHGRIESASQLLAAAPELLDIADRNSVSPVMAAARKRNVFLVQLLLEAGADLAVSDLEGKTIVDYVEGWDEGEQLLEGRNVSVAPAPRRTTVAVPSEEPAPEPQAAEEATDKQEKPANPFGLGGMKKIRKP